MSQTINQVADGESSATTLGRGHRPPLTSPRGESGLGATLSQANLNLIIHAQVMGREVISRGEIVAESQEVWKTQPKCTSFMGRWEAEHDGTGKLAWFRRSIPYYADTISGAWEVVEAMEQRGFLLSLTRTSEPDGWEAEFAYRGTLGVDFEDQLRAIETSAVAARAISLAAIAAVELAPSKPASSE